jgi:ribosomal protein S18 acetylase RimI-like enzyme
VQIRPFAVADTESVVALWQECGLTRPWNDPRKDIERKLSVQPELFLVGEREDEIVATAMAGYDGHRGWVYYVAVAPGARRASVGRCLMAEVEERLLALGCPKVNIQIRSDNGAASAFYERLGYAADGATGMGKRLLPDA